MTAAAAFASLSPDAVAKILVLYELVGQLLEEEGISAACPEAMR